MSIEQKIAEILAESKGQVAEELEEAVEQEFEEEDFEAEDVIDEIKEEILDELSKGTLGSYIKKAGYQNDKSYKRYDGINKAISKLTKEQQEQVNVVIESAELDIEEITVDVSADIEALITGEELTEAFKEKAATIFEAAVVTRVKAEYAQLEEEFEAKLEEAVAENQEGLVEKVDGYLNYVVETWIAQNEIALERGMKSDILENFVSGLKDLFVESWIDVPEEKYDVLADMETQVSELQDKLDEQLAANVEMNKIIAEQTRVDIIKDACNGLTDTEVEKFTGLAEELAYEDADTFATKVQIIRENYFTNKAGKSLVESVVTDTPVESLTEEKVVDPSMKRYMNALNNVK